MSNAKFNDERVNAIPAYSFSEMHDILCALFTPINGVPLPWEKDFNASYTPTIVAPPGVGKSILILEVARTLGNDYKRIPMGETPAGETMPIAQPLGIKTLEDHESKLFVETKKLEARYKTFVRDLSAVNDLAKFESTMVTNATMEHIVDTAWAEAYMRYLGVRTPDTDDVAAIVKARKHDRDLQAKKPIKYEATSVFPCNAPNSESGYGIAHLDEIGTGDGWHRAFASAFLTTGYKTGLHDIKIAPGWWFVATMNPEVAKYGHQLNDQLRDRLRPLFRMETSHDDILTYFSRTRQLPKTLYGFLMLQKGIFNKISARSWETLVDVCKRLENSGYNWRPSKDNARKSIVTAISGSIDNEEVLEALNSYIALGDDPNNFPMDWSTVLRDNFEAARERISFWLRGGKEALLAATMFDLRRFVSITDKMNEDDEDKIVVLMKDLHSSRPDMAVCPIQHTPNQKRVHERLLEKAKNTAEIKDMSKYLTHTTDEMNATTTKKPRGRKAK